MEERVAASSGLELRLDPGSDASGAVPPPPCPGDSCPLTLRAPFSALLPSSGPHPGPPTPGRQQAGGMGGRDALGGTETWCLELAGGCERLLGHPPPPPPAPGTPPPIYGFGEEPGEEQRREGQERTQREGREALRLSLRQRFFILFSPFLM